MSNRSIRAAFVGFGEVNSPKELIDSKCRHALEELKSLGFGIVTTETVTDDLQGADANRAIADLTKEEFDVLVVCLAGWIPSHAVIAVTSQFQNKPMILWGLAGDMKDGRIVTAAAQAGTTALRKVFDDLAYKFKWVYNIIGQPSPLEKIKDFAIAASAVRSMENTKVG